MKKWCKKLYDAKLLLAGEDSPKTKKANEWSGYHGLHPSWKLLTLPVLRTSRAG